MRPLADPKAFFDELAALEREVRAELSADDLAHLRRIERIGRACTAAGWATSVFGPNLVSALLLAQGRTTRWATVAHHISHGGYNRAPGVPERYTSRGFAKGFRRAIDWFDIIRPDGWHAEHNVLHHGNTGDEADPDVVINNVAWLRDAPWPLAVKVAVVGVLASTWKWTYYTPNTLQEAFAADAKAEGRVDERLSLFDRRVWDPRHPKGRVLWMESFLPYAGAQFVLIPCLFLPFGVNAVAGAAVNSLVAEWITNLHTFAIITTNHAGDDVPQFAGPAASREEFVLRQITGSVNHTTGGDLNDLLHGWLNYQIEHHVWPDMTLLQYRSAQPRLKALCEKHGVPYVQESLGTRLKKTVKTMVGAGGTLAAANPELLPA